MATHELLRAAEQFGSTNNIKVIKQLKKLKVSARDRMQHYDAHMNSETHQMQQTVCLARANKLNGDEIDLCKFTRRAKPGEQKAAALTGYCTHIGKPRHINCPEAARRLRPATWLW